MPGKFKWSDRLGVCDTQVGKGLFARQRFRKGQLVGEVTGKIIVGAEYDSRHCIELSRTHVLEPGVPFRYVNHKCQPNCELFSWKPDKHGDESDRVYVQAICTIQAGEELTIDYAWEAEAAIPCRCAAENCRGWIVAIEDLHRVKLRFGRSRQGRQRKRA